MIVDCEFLIVDSIRDFGNQQSEIEKLYLLNFPNS